MARNKHIRTEFVQPGLRLNDVGPGFSDLLSSGTGMPTGAVIERGSTVNGDYIRFADGTQICTAEIDVDINTSAGAVVHTFPQAFVEKPTSSGSMANTINGRAGNATQWTCSAYSHTARTGD